MRSKSFLILGVLVAASAADAATSLDFQYGTALESASARAQAMGSVGVAEFFGGSSLFQNPALLSRHSGRGEFEISGSLTQVAEDRFVPLFDTFDELVAETAFATNRNSYAGGNASAVFDLPESFGTSHTIGVGIFERYDFEYDFREEVRDPDPFASPRDRIIQSNILQTDGGLRSFSLGYGGELLPNLAIGASAHRYFGEMTAFQRVAPVGGTVTATGLDRELTGWGFQLGLSTDLWPRTNIGVSYEAPVSLKGSHLTWESTAGVRSTVAGAPEDGDYDLRYPGVLRFGATHSPRNSLKTLLSIEASLRFWEQHLEDGYADAASRLETGEPADLVVRDTWDVRVGVEHEFYNGMPLRFGFRFLENYADKEAFRSIYSVGTGYPTGPYTINVTGQYHRQTSQQIYQFDAAAPGFSTPQLLNKVEDSIVSLVVGVTREF